jgi:hypothetical protein
MRNLHQIAVQLFPEPFPVSGRLAEAKSPLKRLLPVNNPCRDNRLPLDSLQTPYSVLHCPVHQNIEQTALISGFFPAPEKVPALKNRLPAPP